MFERDGRCALCSGRAATGATGEAGWEEGKETEMGEDMDAERLRGECIVAAAAGHSEGLLRFLEGKVAIVELWRRRGPRSQGSGAVVVVGCRELVQAPSSADRHLFCVFLRARPWLLLS